MARNFILTNANGVSINLSSDTFFAHGPIGLGLSLNNVYSQYQSYLIKTRTQVSQGSLQTKILFSQIDSQTYQTFSDFAEFLAYQPYTLEYDTDAGSWYRDCYLKEMPKSEAGVDTAGLLDEQITLEFINNWYNNKSAVYKSYSPDPNLGQYGKGYFHDGGHSINWNDDNLVGLAIVGTAKTVNNYSTGGQS